MGSKPSAKGHLRGIAGKVKSCNYHFGGQPVNEVWTNAIINNSQEAVLMKRLAEEVFRTVE